jgi:uncharacterized membrane protein
MELNSDIPKLKVSRKKVDWIMEVAAFIFLIILFALPIYFHNKIPEIIPTHYNISGVPDDYGSAGTLWLLPITGLVIYIVITVLESYPYIYNYPVKITPQNAYRQYTMATRLMRFLKTVVLIMFSFLTYQTIEVALGNKYGMGKILLPVFLIAVFGILIVYLVKSRNTRTDGDSML